MIYITNLISLFLTHERKLFVLHLNIWRQMLHALSLCVSYTSVPNVSKAMYICFFSSNILMNRSAHLSYLPSKKLHCCPETWYGHIILENKLFQWVKRLVSEEVTVWGARSVIVLVEYLLQVWEILYSTLYRYILRLASPVSWFLIVED